MAQTIELANIEAKNFVDSTSRYASSSVLYYGDKKLLTFATYKKQPKSFSPDDRFTVVSKGHEYRPDLLSKRVYGVVGHWWKILEANDIKDIYDFKSGLNIRLPANMF